MIALYGSLGMMGDTVITEGELHKKCADPLFVIELQLRVGNVKLLISSKLGVY